MKFTEYIKNKDLKFDFFIKTLSNTNRTPDYYVNWNKVLQNKKEVELQLNTLNHLIGKEDIENEALRLFKQQPDLLKVVPSLIAKKSN